MVSPRPSPPLSRYSSAPNVLSSHHSSRSTVRDILRRYPSLLGQRVARESRSTRLTQSRRLPVGRFQLVFQDGVRVPLSSIAGELGAWLPSRLPLRRIFLPRKFTHSLNSNPRNTSHLHACSVIRAALLLFRAPVDLAGPLRTTMVILAHRHQSPFGQSLSPVVSTERDTPSITQARLASKLEAGSFLPAHMRGEMTPDARRTLSLSLTLTHWTPLPSEGLWKGSTTFDASLTANITGFYSPLVTSSGTPPASNARLTPPRIEHAPNETDIRGRSMADSQQTTGRFPRFFAYLLRHGIPGSESDEGRSRPCPRSPLRRSADPGGAQASVATIPDAPAQCGVGDETGLQSCAAASAAGTLALPLAHRSSSPSRASTPATPAPADTLALRLAPVSEHLGVLWQEDSFSVSGTPVSVSVSVTAMASHPPSTSTSRGGVGVGERIVTESSQLSFPPGSQNHSTSMRAVSNSYDDADADGDEQDEQAQDAQNPAGNSGAQTQDGQPRKKKTRRAGAAITRVRRLQREVRRLAEEGEESPQQPAARRTLLQPLAVQPMYPSSAHPVQMSLGSPTSARYGQYPGGVPLASPATSPPPRPLTTPAASGHARQTRSEATPPGHGLAPAAHAHSRARGPLYDRILEDGDDVVLMPRLPSASPTGSSIWAIRPEERPRERDSTRPRGGST